MLIEEEMKTYDDVLWGIINDFKGRNLVPLLGAGISFEEPSNLPQGNGLKSPLVESLKQTHSELVDRNLISDSSEIIGLVKELKLENLLDGFERAYGEKALECLEVLNTKIWNENHSSLALLSRQGLLPWCITLNFDLLIEEAFLYHEGTCTTISPLIRKSFVTGDGTSSTNIIKPHGSIVGPNVSENFYDHISTTISKIGKKPALENIEMFEKAFEDCKTLLVAGYSDDDWDVFPIFHILKNKPKKIIWIFHPSDPPEDKEKIKKNVAKVGIEVDYICEPAVNIFKRVTQEITGVAPEYSDNKMGKPVSNFQIFEPSFESSLIRNSLALAWLIETTRYHQTLLKWISHTPLIKEDNNLRWQIEHIWNYLYHCEQRYRKARDHKRKEIQILKKCENSESLITSAYLWMGYQYLCSIKPKMFLLLGLIVCIVLLFYSVGSGNYLLGTLSVAIPTIYFTYCNIQAQRYLRKGADPYIQHGDENPLSDHAEFYKINFLHSWASCLLVFGPLFSPVTKIIFKCITKQYDQIDRAFFDTAYFYQRRLESWLLCDDKRIRDPKVEFKMAEYKRIDDLIKQSDPSGNIPTFTALYRYVLNESGIKKCEKREIGFLLDDAERRWMAHNRVILSGLYRVLLFQLYMGFYPRAVKTSFKIVKHYFS